MRFKSNIFTVVIMLFVISGQTVSATGMPSIDLIASEMSMSHMDHDQKTTKNCCNDHADCEMNCSLYMNMFLHNTNSFEGHSTVSEKCIIINSSTTAQFYTFPLRPPIYF